MGENFALRWNDFHSNLESLFKHLRSATEYQDVTLVCGREAAEVRAHKVRGELKVSTKIRGIILIHSAKFVVTV